MSSDSCMTSLKRKASEVNVLLVSTYGRKSATGRGNPMDTLVETILSQNTSDVNSHRAFEALTRRYRSWKELLKDSPEEVADVIRCGGLAETKARRILGVMNLLMAQRGELDLNFLSDMTVEEAERWLTSIEGIGPKTAAIVLLFSFGMPAFPVDTHIFRVSRRLGFIADGVSREKAQKELGQLISPEEYHNMHLNLIEHGRRFCRPRNPLCDMCVISEFCLHYRGSTKAQA